MIDKIEEVEHYLDEHNCYIEPRFTTVNNVDKDALLTAYQGQEMYPYCVRPQNMGQLRKYAQDLHTPVIVHRGLEIDSFDELFNIRQNPVLAWHYVVEFGLGEEELAYAKRMLSNKFRWFLLSVPHGAQTSVVDQVVAFRMFAPDAVLMVGNFYNQEGIDEVVMQLNNRGAYRVDFWQIVVEKDDLGVENLGLASVAKIRLAGYPIIVCSRTVSPKTLFFALASGAKWVTFTNPPEDTDWNSVVHEPVLKLLHWQNLTSLDDVQEHVVLKWRR